MRKFSATWSCRDGFPSLFFARRLDAKVRCEMALNNSQSRVSLQRISNRNLSDIAKQEQWSSQSQTMQRVSLVVARILAPNNRDLSFVQLPFPALKILHCSRGVVLSVLVFSLKFVLHRQCCTSQEPEQTCPRISSLQYYLYGFNGSEFLPIQRADTS